GTRATHTAPNRGRDYSVPVPFLPCVALISYRSREALSRRTSHAPNPTTAESGTTTASRSSLPKASKSTTAENTSDQVCHFMKSSVIRWLSGRAGVRPTPLPGKLKRSQSATPSARPANLPYSRPPARKPVATDDRVEETA